MVTFLRRYGIWLVAVIICAALPYIFNSRFSISLLCQTGIAIIFALSYNMLLGEGGMLSFGHAAFYGLGGFMAIHALIMIDHGFPLPLELLPLVGGLGALVFGLVLGWLSTARSGTTFALITLGIGELVVSSSLLLPSFFGGEQGISADRMVKMTITGLNFGHQRQVYFLIAFWMLVCAVLMRLLTQTPLGKAANAVRDNPERAAFIGYNPRTVRTLQFTLSAFFAGLAGGLLAINYEIVTADTVGALASANVLMMTYVGGVGYFFGPILGAILVTFMQVSLAGVTHAWPLYFGLTFVGMILWAPNGLAGIIMAHEPVWKAGLMKRLLPAYALIAVPSLVMFTGFMTLVEINYHLSLSIQPQNPMTLFGITFHAQSPIAWALSITLLVGGFISFRKAQRKVRQSWNAVAQMMQTSREAN